MNEQPADLRKTSSPLRDQMEAAMLRNGFSPTTMADAAWAVIEPELIDQFHKRDQVIHWLAATEAERDQAKAAIAKFREYLDSNFRQWCSPHGIASDYATKLIAELDQIKDRERNDLPAVREFAANLDPRKEG